MRPSWAKPSSEAHCLEVTPYPLRPTSRALPPPLHPPTRALGVAPCRAVNLPGCACPALCIPGWPTRVWYAVGAQFTWGRGRGDESLSNQGFDPGTEVVLGERVWAASGRGGPARQLSPLPFDPGSRSHPADTLGGPAAQSRPPPSSADSTPTLTGGPGLHPHPNFPPRRPGRGGGPENGARTLSTPRVICSFSPPRWLIYFRARGGRGVGLGREG